MLLLIILTILALGGLIGGHFWEKAHECDMSPLGFVLSCTGVSATLALIVIGVCFMATDKDYEEFVAERDNIAELVEKYPVGQGNGEYAPIVEKTIKINERIADNKVKCKSKWVGVFYSKKIGNAEPIKLPDFVKPGEE